MRTFALLALCFAVTLVVVSVGAAASPTSSATLAAGPELDPNGLSRA